MSIAARLPRPVATLDPKRIAGTSLAIAVHGVVLMMLLMPMQVADPPARLDTPMVVLPIHTIPPPVDPPPRDERPRPVIRQTQTTPRPLEVPVLNTDPSPVDTYVEQVTLDPVPDTDFRVDPPPTFARIVADVAPPPTYPPQALRLRQSGEVVLRVLVDEAGRPAEVAIESSSGYRLLDEAALKAVKKRWRFVPARQDGAAIQAWALVPVRFELER